MSFNEKLTKGLSVRLTRLQFLKAGRGLGRWPRFGIAWAGRDSRGSPVQRRMLPGFVLLRLSK